MWRGRRAGGRNAGDPMPSDAGWRRPRSLRWAIAGAALGVVFALVVFAPAAWLADAVADATRQRVLLADARGTVWSGDAVAVLTGGPDSRDASALPGRLRWTLGFAGTAIELRTEHACCLNGTVVLRVKPGFGRVTTTLLPSPGWTAQWPSALLNGLGTPFNTMQLGGTIRLSSPGLAVESVQGRVRFDGRADIELLQAASRLTTLDPLGSYRFTLTGNPAQAGGAAQLHLATEEGALVLQGDGVWEPAGGFRFRGEARAASPDDAAKLSNLLNIIGRRQGARSVISIG
jgi:general secretion pathway protein N